MYRISKRLIYIFFFCYKVNQSNLMFIIIATFTFLINTNALNEIISRYDFFVVLIITTSIMFFI